VFIEWCAPARQRNNDVSVALLLIARADPSNASRLAFYANWLEDRQIDSDAALKCK